MGMQLHAISQVDGYCPFKSLALMQYNSSGSTKVHEVPFFYTLCRIMDPCFKNASPLGHDFFICGSMIVHQVYNCTSCTILDPGFVFLCGSMIVHQVYHDTSFTILDPGFIFLCGSMIVHQIYHETSCTILDPGFIFLCGSMIVHQVYNCTSCTILDPGFIFLSGSTIVHQVYHDTSYKMGLVNFGQ